MNTIPFKKGKVLVIAHRGLSGIEKENTTSAFVAAGNRSYYGIETDIHRTSDGYFVVNHDMTLERVAGVNINVEENPLSALQEVILMDKDGTKDRFDLRPCILQDYLKICKKYEKHCVLELKSKFTDEEIEKIINIIKEFDYLDNTTFISFKYDNLLKVRKVLPNHSVQYLVDMITDEVIKKVTADRIDIDVEQSDLTQEKLKRIHDAGLKVNCWTVDRIEDAERLAEWGVEYITTNILE